MYTCVYIYMCVLLRRRVPCGLAGCRSFPPSPPVKARPTRGLWFAKRYLMLQISPTP